jgi:hypothetical protein
MPKRLSIFCFLLSVLLPALPAVAQQEIELRARARLFPDAPAGIAALKFRAVGDSRHYYLLAARGTTVLIYDAAGNRVAQIGAPTPAPGAAAPASSGQPLLQFGADLDLACPQKPAASEPCLLYVADRGAGAVKVLTLEGQLLRSIPAPGPTSLVALSEGEIAVATMRGTRLVSIYDRDGKLAREFGAPAEVADADLNRSLNIGRLATDAANHVYYSFSYLPEPTVRKYDRFGWAVMEVELTSLDFAPTSQAARRAIARLGEPGGRGAPLKAVVGAIAVDPESQAIWIGAGGLLIHFDREGNRRGTYRLFTAEGARIEAAAILIEPERLLVASETLGVFEFPRPDKPRR